MIRHHRRGYAAGRKGLCVRCATFLAGVARALHLYMTYRYGLRYAGTRGRTSNDRHKSVVEK